MRFKLLAVLLLVLAGWAGWAASRPAHFAVESALEINAPPTVIYNYVADLRAWPAWWPDEQDDSQVQRRYAGPANGLGSSYRWTSPGPAGSGEMVVVQAEAGAQLRIDYTLSAPQTAHESVGFVFTAKGAATMLKMTRAGDISLAQRLRAPWRDYNPDRVADIDAALAAIKLAVEES